MRYIKFMYNPGIYPTPLLSYFNHSNIKAFNEKYEFEFGIWNEQMNSIWNQGAYIIYNDKNVEAYRFNELSYLVWLLRIINRKINISLPKNCLDEIKEAYKSEFIEIK